MQVRCRGSFFNPACAIAGWAQNSKLDEKHLQILLHLRVSAQKVSGVKSCCQICPNVFNFPLSPGISSFKSNLSNIIGFEALRLSARIGSFRPLKAMYGRRTLRMGWDNAAACLLRAPACFFKGKFWRRACKTKAAPCSAAASRQKNGGGKFRPASFRSMALCRSVPRYALECCP